MFRKQKAQQLIVIGEYSVSRNTEAKRIRTIRLPEAQGRRGRNRSEAALKRIYSQEYSIAVIDGNDEAWLITQPNNPPVNLSSLLRRKISKVFLGEKEAIVLSRGEYVLVNWGSVKALEGELTRISTFSSNQYDSLFIAYLIPTTHPIMFHYSLEKKVDNSNRLYEIRPSACTIIAHPTLTTLRTIRPVKGVSIGRHHSLCWDQQGQLFSWGCRSLGLGYGELPIEDLVQSPRLVRLGKHVLMAFAATHYSLALTSQGVVYEWGIKPEYNQINEEPIFLPRPLDFRFFRCNAKFISLKGRDNNFAALASTGQLYVWGLNARQLLPPEMQLPPAWQGSHVYQPVLQMDLIGQRVKDFSIQIGYLCVVVGEESAEDGQEEYWSVLRERARMQLATFKVNRVCTEASQPVTYLRKKYRNPILGEHTTERKPSAACRLNTDSSTNAPQRISSPLQPQHPYHHQRHNHQSLDHSTPKMVLNLAFKQTAPFNSTCWPSLSVAHKRQISQFLSSNTQPNEGSNLRCSQLGLGLRREESMGKNESKKFSDSYTMRRQIVLEKKQKLENQSLANNLKKIDEADVEFKARRKMEEQARKKKEKQGHILHSGLLPFLAKAFLCRLLTSPLDEGRNALISNFSRSLVLARVQKNIKRLFIDAKIKFSLRALEKQSMPRYTLLALYFRNYVVRFRERRAQRMRGLAIQALVTRATGIRLKQGVGKMGTTVGKLTRLGQWLIHHNRERLRVLRQLWNNFVLYSLKPSDGGQINLHLTPQATFAQRFQAAVEAKTVGGLEQCYRRVVRVRIGRKCTKKTLTEMRRRANLRPIEQFKLSSVQILPYSLHYNSLRHPKHLDISLPQSTKTSACWIQIQRHTLNDILIGMLHQQDKKFYLQQREYQLQLARYIHSHYDSFYELRWRFIIEYNKVEKTADKRRREKELRRLLGLVGMQRLFDQDCIPQKSLVLEEALRRRDAPRRPSPILHFDLAVFQVIFKSYWESLHSKAKQVRKRNF